MKQAKIRANQESNVRIGRRAARRRGRLVAQAALVALPALLSAREAMAATTYTWSGLNPNNNFTSANNWTISGSKQAVIPGANGTANGDIAIIASGANQIGNGTAAGVMNWNASSKAGTNTNYFVGAIEFAEKNGAGNDSADTDLTLTNNNAAGAANNVLVTLMGSGTISTFSNVILSNTTTSKATTFTINNTASTATLSLALGNSTNNVVYVGTGNTIDLESSIGQASGVNGTLTLVGQSANSTLILGGSNTYTGNTIASGGTLMAAFNSFNSGGGSTGTGSVTLNAATLSSKAAQTSFIVGSVIATSGSNIISPGGSGTIGTLSIGGTLTLNNGATILLDVNGASADQLNVTGALSLSSAPAITLASGNSYTVGTNYTLLNYGNTPGLTAASFNLPAAPANFAWNVTAIDLELDALNNPALTWAGASGTASGNWNTTETNWTPGGSKYADGDPVTFTDIGSLASGTVTITAGGVLPGGVTVNGSTTSYTFTGGSINGSTGLTKSGSTTLTLAATNGYSGATVVSGGTIQAGIDNALSPASAVTLANLSGVLLDLNGHNQTIKQLLGGGTTGGNVALGGGTLTFGDSTAVTTFAGVISDSGGASSATGGSIVKTGSGQVFLAATETYGGSTTISAGELSLATTGAALPSTTNLTIANVAGAILQLNGNNTTVQELSGGGGNGGQLSLNKGTVAPTFTVGDANSTTFAGLVSGSGNFIKTGTGSLTLSGTAGYTGQTTVSAGTLVLNGAITNTGAIAIASGNGSSLVLQPTGSGTLTLMSTGANTINGNLTLGSPFVYALVDPNSGADPFSGNGSIQVTASGTTLTNASSKAGPIVSVPVSLNPNDAGAFQKGTLAVTSGSVTYSPGSFVTTIGGSTAGFGITFAGAISGASDVNLANDPNTGGGKGSLMLSGSSTYTGNTLFNVNDGGAVVIGAENALPIKTDFIYGTLSSAGTGTLDLNGHTLTVGSLADGPVAGAKLLTISSSNGAATLGVDGDTTPANGFADRIVDGNGTVALVKSGVGTLTLSGASNTYSGGTTINGGSIRANGANSLGTSNIAVNAGGTLGGNGTIQNASKLLSVSSGGTITAGADATHTGNLTTGDQSWSGGGSYAWKINTDGLTAGGQAGNAVGWDELTLSNLTVATAGGPLFTISVQSFGGNVAHTTVSGFDTSSADSWTIAHITGAVTINGSPVNATSSSIPLTGTASDAFALDTAAFRTDNSLPASGSFELDLAPDTAGGQDLVLNYNTAPEPGTMLLVLGGAAPMLLGRRRRKAVAK